jgi:hypothetical protein
LGVQQNVTLSIRAIDVGLTAFNDTGYDLTNIGADPRVNYSGEMPWFGSLPQVEQRIATAIAVHPLHDAVALTPDQLAARNALPVRKTRFDGSQYDKYPDGRRVEVKDDPTTVAS